MPDPVDLGRRAECVPNVSSHINYKLVCKIVLPPVTPTICVIDARSAPQRFIRSMQFDSVSNVAYQNVYQKFLDSVNLFNFDMSWVVSIGCFFEVDFHDRLLWTTITPVVIMGVLGITYVVAVHSHRKYPQTFFRKIQEKHVSMALLVTFLVYSSVSSVVFQMFACDKLDTGKSYLRADYTIECDSDKHRALQIYAGLMIMLYPVGIPALYAGLLFSNRRVLRDEKSREESHIARPISGLWKPYKPQRFYYEVIECARRILLTGAVVFIYPNTASQIAVAFAIAVFFVFVSEAMAPYKSCWDAWISRTGHAIVFASMYFALLLKVDVSGENDSSQETFGVILVGVHGCMIFAVIVQAVVLAMSLRSTKPLEGPRPRPRRLSNFELRVQSPIVEEGGAGKDGSPAGWKIELDT